MKKLIYLFCCASLLFAACGDDQSVVDEEIISEFLTENNIDATRTDSGLYYEITQEGTGDSPTLLNTVTVRYIGKFLDGTVFDSSNGGTTSFELANVIEGWREGIRLLKPGGSGTFYIPSDLGYGSSGNGPIPPNTVLVFDVDLVDFF